MDYKEISRGLPKEEAERYATGIKLANKFFDSLEAGGFLPKRFTKPVVDDLSVQPDVSGEAVTFTDEERKALLDDGALLYLPTGETIRSQKSAKRPFWYITNGYKADGKNRLTEFPSRRIEVAIYSDPERFFVPDSFSKTTDQQIALVETDAHSLRERLGLPNIGEILPEASEATEVLFKHFDATSIRLLGQDYIRIRDGYWSYIRTSTPTNKVGSNVACVGRWDAGNGLYVGDWIRDKSDVNVGAARWVVPTGTR